MSIRWFVLLSVFLSSILPSWADLGDLLAWQKRGDSGAYVSSGFHDPRGVSKYRSRPGLHAGYDIAMLAGSAVRSPWPGTVVAITPWYGAEVGVTVRLFNGWEATFGHITSAVRVGDSVSPGELLGHVVVDHVDVKMRDSSGVHVDFGTHPIASSGPAASRRVAPPREDRVKALAAGRAFAEYEKLVSRLAEEEAQVRQGLRAAAAPAKVRTRLAELRPLAVYHARHSGVELPTRPAAQPTIPLESERPLTDQLLGL